MPTQEERLTILERTIGEYRPVLRDITYELSMVKGIIIDQVKIVQELSQNASETNEHLETIDQHLDRLEAQFDEQKTLLKEHTAILIQILEHLKTP